MSLTRADLSGGVKLSLDQNLSISSRKASYDRAANQVTAPGRVRIRHALADIEGVGLAADLASGVFALESKVRTVLKPRSVTAKDRG